MKHLTLADEIVVLMLRDDTGEIKSARADSASIAIAGGILMELSLLGRIDTDLTSLFIIDPKPVGDELLDCSAPDRCRGRKTVELMVDRAARPSRPRSRQ
jgi:hypothetical protein